MPMFTQQNIALIQAHGYNRQSSRVQKKGAEVPGVCERCSKTINKGDLVVWHRKHGVFHAASPCNPHELSAGTIDAASISRMIEQALENFEPAADVAVDESRLMEMVREAVDKQRPLARELHVKLDNTGKIAKIKSPHKELETLMTAVATGDHAYLYGPPGSGKSTGAMHAAEALQRAYGYISLNPQTPESRLLGYMDANGVYRATIFFKLYTEGGVFCIDEMDNASAALLTTLNSLLENGKGAFPHGVFDRHPDFIVVATGNTTGRGGNKMFPERRAFDAAFAERFVFIFWGYDEVMERNVALATNGNAAAWVTWVQKVRAFAVQHDPQLVVSPRATFKIAKYLKTTMKPLAIVEMVLFKGIEAQRKDRILSANPLPVAA